MSCIVTHSLEDIPGANLSEPYEKHTIFPLCWMLLCRGINTTQPSSLNDFVSLLLGLWSSNKDSLAAGILESTLFFLLNWNISYGVSETGILKALCCKSPLTAIRYSSLHPAVMSR